jgi:transglutaminase-like putative cysteine protease
MKKFIHLTPLSVSHLSFFALIALYLCSFHSASYNAVMIIFLTGVVAELLPRVLRNFFIPEFLLVLSTACCWWLVIPPGNHAAIHGTAGIAIAYWLLIPSRLGMLRWVLSLVIVELVLLSRQHSMSMWGLVTVPLGVAALALDSWLTHAIPARASARLKAKITASLVRWVFVPLVLVAVAALAFGSWLIQETTHYHALHQPKSTKTNKLGPVVIGLEESLSIGNHNTVDRDPRIAARLTWETGADPTGMVYIRALALSELIIQGSTLSWKPNASGPLNPAPPATHQPTRWARILRMPSRTDVVLRPDGGDAVDLDDLVVDADLNLYRPQLGEALRSYRVDFDDGQLEADPATLYRYQTVDPALNNLPWEQIEDPRWKTVSPERAATLIKLMLNERCTYDLENLPSAAPGAGGVLRSFLFGRTAAERRGHCQYFSTAAVLLLRRAGHTARCVAGFASDEFDDRGLVFRGLHAHAWIEVVNAQGRWQRFDPTPGSRNTRIMEGMENLTGNSTSPDELIPDALPPVVNKPENVLTHMSENWWQWSFVGGAIVVLLCIFMVRQKRHQRDPHVSELQRRHDDLLRLAIALGIPVTPATTLSEITAVLEQRSGLTLQRHLDAHLRARFDHGPLPPPWPIAEIRAKISTLPNKGSSTHKKAYGERTE